jgi:uncharacterized membrane protein
MKHVLTSAEQLAVQQAIAEAESKTTGEIRVHIDRKCAIDPLVHAMKLFLKLSMDKTAFRNAALIYLAVDDHKVAIVGDEALNEVVPPHFWEDECDLMITHFKNGNISEGLCAGIAEVGKELALYFPSTDEEVNELSDEISFGND